MTGRQFRGTQAWKRARKIAMRGAQFCAICGNELRFDVGYRHPDAPSVDHVIPLAHLDLSTPEGRATAVDQSLLRVAHLGCNAGRRDRVHEPYHSERKQPRRRSRRW